MLAIVKAQAALFKYLKPAKDSLPNPKGSLAASVPSHAITATAVRQQKEKASSPQYPKRSQFTVFTPEIFCIQDI